MMDGKTDFCSVMMMTGKSFFDFFSLSPVPANMDLFKKTLLFGATFLIDFNFFEYKGWFTYLLGQQQDLLSYFMSLSVPCCGTGIF